MQMQQQTQQIGQQSFQRQQAQQMQIMQQQQFYNNQRQASLRQQQMQQMLRYPLPPEQLEKQQAHQQEAEAQATDYLAHFAEDQRNLRLAHPAADAQQAAAEQQEDARKLTTATVKAYREVFLPGQVLAVMQARALSPKSQRSWQAVHQDLLDKAWWGKQDAAQANSQRTPVLWPRSPPTCWASTSPRPRRFRPRSRPAPSMPSWPPNLSTRPRPRS